MRRNRSAPAGTVTPVLAYPDVRTAVAWLEAAFGFSERVRIGDAHRAQLAVGDGSVIVADVRGSRRPPTPDDRSHAVMVQVEDARGHCEKARAHGAHIVMDPTDFEYGERQYTALDLAGHEWTFTETLADVAPETWGWHDRRRRLVTGLRDPTGRAPATWPLMKEPPHPIELQQGADESSASRSGQVREPGHADR